MWEDSDGSGLAVFRVRSHIGYDLVTWGILRR